MDLLSNLLLEREREDKGRIEDLVALFDGESRAQLRRFMLAIKRFVAVSMRSEFALDEAAFKEYEASRRPLYDNPDFQMNYSLKSHIIMHHCHPYMVMTGQNFSKTSAEAIESSHQRLRDLERIHGKMTKMRLRLERRRWRR